MKDITNNKFGKLIALFPISKTRNGHVRWSCLCDCGREHSVLSTHLISNKITHCGCEKRSGKAHKQWKGVGDISGDLFNELQRKSKRSPSRKEIEFSVSIEYLWELYLNQKGLCALSGLHIYFKHKDGIRTRNSKNASLDRIDSSIGYVEGNVQWVHKDINIMKNKFDQKLFVEYCKLIARKDSDENT